MISKNKRQKSRILNLSILIGQKKGMEKIMSVYWFVILALVAGAIVFMVYSFYGNPYDVRHIEAEVLSNKIIECLSGDDGLVKIDNNFNEDFLNKCHLDFQTEDEKTQYYVEVKFYDFNSNTPLNFEITGKGDVNLKNYLGDLQNSDAVGFSNKSFYIMDKENNGGKERGVIVSITAIVDKSNENVK